MDTGAGSKGFSIIAQGMIGKIITAKPEDRRYGLSKKRRGSQSSKLVKRIPTQVSFDRSKLGAFARHHWRAENAKSNLLQRQAQRAERYRNIKNQIEDLDLWLSSAQYIELKRAADEAQAIFNEAKAWKWKAKPTSALYKRNWMF